MKRGISERKVKQSKEHQRQGKQKNEKTRKEIENQ